MNHLPRKSKAFALAALVLPILVITGCGGASSKHSTSSPSNAAPSGTPLTSNTFRTILPDNWQTTNDTGLCGTSTLVCLYATQGGVGNGAPAVIEVHTLPQSVADSQLPNDLKTAVKSLGGRQNIVYKPMKVGSTPAIAADFYSSGGGYASENFELLRLNHGGKTYAVDLSERADIKNPVKWLTTAYLPAFHHMLAAWQWR